jgi:uncharacterized protein (DUF362 family)
MTFDRSITRRESLKKILKVSGSLAVAVSAPLSTHFSRHAFAENENQIFIAEGFGNPAGYTIRELTRKTFETAGGMKRFISRGDVVVIKPNLSWARAPHLAATTNPEVLKAVIELCQEAGAKKVRIADHTIHEAQRCFAITGAGQVAKETGAELIFPRSSLMRDMNLNGNRLGQWPVYTPVVEADKLINLPVAKVHGLTDLTLGIKNWIGAVGGRRYALHQDIHQTIVDLAQFFKPVVTLIDATRIMVSNGPSGGNDSDVAVKNRLILSNDPVAADARAAALFGYAPEDIGFIRLAKKRGLGAYDTEIARQYEVSV